MKPANVVRTQIAVAIATLASLVAFAANGPTDLGDETQSFVGTTPNAAVAEAQPSTF
jgi:hypothetical protein